MEAEMEAEKAEESLQIYEEEEMGEERKYIKLVIGHWQPPGSFVPHPNQTPLSFLPHRVTQFSQMVIQLRNQSLIRQETNSLNYVLTR